LPVGCCSSSRFGHNPIVWKNFYARMRTQALFSFLFVFVISAFVTFTTYGGIMRIQGDAVVAARTAIVPLGMIQWFIMMLSATGRITSGIIHERVTGTIEYTRLTPSARSTRSSVICSGCRCANICCSC
jgi:ABC-type uncharacterized transport system permease subunit